MMVDISIEGGDRWNIPDDRQLALRGRLDTGWSSYREGVYSRQYDDPLTHHEQDKVQAVLDRMEAQQLQEQERIGTLVKKLKLMRENVLGDGEVTCLICGTKTGLLKESLRYCSKCGKMVCPKCSIDAPTFVDVSGKCYFCVLCYEERQLWKRSGAWFYSVMPKYVIPEVNSGRQSNSLNRGSHSGSINQPRSYHGSLARSRSGSYNSTQKGVESAEESDDSDLETTSLKAFDIPENRRSISLHGQQIDMDEESVIGRNKRSSNVLTQRPKALKTPPFEYSPLEDEHNNSYMPSDDNHYTSQNSLASCNEVKSPTSSKNCTLTLDSQASFGSTSSLDVKSEKRHKLGVKKVWGKLSQDKSSRSSMEPSPIMPKKINGHDSRLGSDAASHDSEQDVDAIFNSYEQDQVDKPPEKKEYHGKYGMIEFTLQYDPNTQELLVIVHTCKGLKGGNDKGKLPYPYIKTYLLPEAAKASKKRTATIKKTADPVYNETLVYYGISESDIASKGLRLSVMDEKVGSNAIIGGTCIPLKNLTTRPVQQFRRLIDPRINEETLYLDSKNTSSNPGRIELALHYLSKQDKLVIGIIRCAGLKSLDANGYSDPYVKCYLLPDPHKRSKQKTNIKKKTLNPEFNEEFTYKVPRDELAKKTLHISVWDHDIGRTNDFIGGVSLGIDASGEALKHWFETLKTADRRVIRWHTLTEEFPIIHE